MEHTVFLNVPQGQKLNAAKFNVFSKWIPICFEDGLNLNDVDAVMREVHTFLSAYVPWNMLGLMFSLVIKKKLRC